MKFIERLEEIADTMDASSSSEAIVIADYINDIAGSFLDEDKETEEFKEHIMVVLGELKGWIEYVEKELNQEEVDK